MNSEKVGGWKDTINKELQNLYENSVMIIVENKNIPNGIKLLDVKWVFTIKDNGIYKKSNIGGQRFSIN